jgi:superfamily I DNA/RNA helicase
MVEWTPEQLAIINSIKGKDGLYVVDAAAGSGKTTTAIETVKQFLQLNPQGKVLILVRGRDLKEKLKQEFLSTNVECATIHSYALKRFKIQKGLRNGDIKIAETRKDLFEVIGKIKSTEPSFKYVSANSLANMFDDYYSKDQFTTIGAYITYLTQDIRHLREATKSVKVNDKILDCFHYIYATMENNNIFTHDMYIKNYALNYTDRSSFDLVVIDEAQDLNKYMSKLLSRIDYKKMYIIGDEHQQLFSWDNCINIIATYKTKADKVFSLTKSFRMNPVNLICSNHLLTYLDTLSYKATPVVAGHDIKELPEKFTKATLFRTNAAMILSALNTIISNPNIKIQFKGFDNTSVKSLFGNRLHYILSFLELDGRTEVKESIENKYKAWINSIPFILQDAYDQAKLEKIPFHTYLSNFGRNLEPELRQSHRLYMSMIMSHLGIEGCLELLQKNLKKKVTSDTLIEEYSTAHKAKGFEWDYVILGDDIWDFDRIDDFCASYVAATRGRIKCDTSALQKPIEYYNEVKDYLDWTPTLNGYDGNIEKDLRFAKLKKILREIIPIIDELPEDDVIILYDMYLDNKLPSDVDYSDLETIEDLIGEYECECSNENENVGTMVMSDAIASIVK